MTPLDIDQLVVLCRVRAGLEVSPDKAYLIETRLTPVARREGFTTAAELMAGVRSGREERLAWAVVEAMTVSQTTFFRDRQAFDAIRETLLPHLVARSGGAPLRLWSAGCAGGAEAYSLAMTVTDAGLPAEARIEIVGSDISERSLEKARSGLFTQFEVQRGLPVRHLLRYFVKQDEMWSVTPRLKSAVRWRRDNLIGDLGGLGSFDLILCRHVLPMMDPAIHRRVTDALIARLAPGGFLLMGADEVEGRPAGPLQPVDGVPGLYRLDADIVRVA